MLAGMQDMRGVLVNEGYDIQPTAEEMEKQRENILYKKTVKFEEFNVKTFDLSKAGDIKEYRKTVKMLYEGAQAKTHLILFHERKFIDDIRNEAGGPRWVVHIEWMEYSFNKEPYPTVGS